MSTPYDLYIRFLITTGVKTPEDISSKLTELNFPGSGSYLAGTIEAQEAVVSHTLPEGVLRQIEKRSFCGDFLHWMKILEVEDLWLFEKEFRNKDAAKRSAIKITYDINQDPKLRLALSSLLMKGIPHSELSQMLSSRFASFLREEHVTLFERFFFNVKRMTRKDWKKFLGYCNREETRVYFTALSEPLDILKTELELPAKVSSSETLQYLLTKAHIKAKQYLAVGTPDGNKEARMWIETVVQLVDKYEKYRAGDASDFSSALQLEFDFSEGEFETPDPEVLSEISAKLKKEADEELSKKEARKKKEGGDEESGSANNEQPAEAAVLEPGRLL